MSSQNIDLSHWEILYNGEINDKYLYLSMENDVHRTSWSTGWQPCFLYQKVHIQISVRGSVIQIKNFFSFSQYI
jgi:hypothetical protein